MGTEQQLDLNQQSSLDVSNYWGGLFTNIKCLSFWQYMSLLAFNRARAAWLCPVVSSVVALVYVATPPMKECWGGSLLGFFFSQTSHACQVRGSQRAATKSSSALGLRSDACSINSPSGETCGVVFIFESRRTSVWEKQCGWAMGYAGPKTEASHSRSSDKFPSSSSRSSSSSGL